MARDPIDSFIEVYVQALHDQNAALFAGAGLSIPAGLVNWKELLKNIAADVGLDIRKEDDLISVAQYHFNEHRGRHRINQALIDNFLIRTRTRLLSALWTNADLISVAQYHFNEHRGRHRINQAVIDNFLIRTRTRLLSALWTNAVRHWSASTRRHLHRPTTNLTRLSLATVQKIRSEERPVGKERRP